MSTIDSSTTTAGASSIVRVSRQQLRENFAAVDRAAPCELLAVVKGDGYGHGLETAVEAFASAGAKSVGIATLAEAAAIRSRYAALRILLLREPCAAELELLGSLGVETIVRSVKSAALRSHAPRIGLHIDLDTGLGRGGFSGEEALELASSSTRGIVGACAQVTPGVSSDEVDSLATLLREIGRELERRGVAAPLLHIGGSECLAHFDRIRGLTLRVGRLLYGIHPSSATQRLAVQPAYAWSARLRRVGHGGTVGYARQPTDGERFELEVGYADGLPASAVGWPVFASDARLQIVAVLMHAALAVGDAPALASGRALLLGTDGTATIEPRAIAELLRIPTSAVLLLPRSPRMAS